MQFTEQEIVEFALRKCGVVGAGQSIPAEDYAVGKTAYDGIRASLPLLGVSLAEVSPASGYTTWVLDENQKEVWAYGFGYWVAAELCDDFVVATDVAQRIQARAASFKELLLQYAPDNGPLVFTVDNG